MISGTPNKKIILLCGLFFAGCTFAKSNTQVLQIGSVKLNVEVAKTEAELQKGLMYRKTLEQNDGMLFVFQQQRILSFWMKNTFIPLDIGFFDKDRVLVDIQSMEPVKSEMQVNVPTYESRKPALYALETNKGWFAKHKIKLGQKFDLRGAEH